MLDPLYSITIDVLQKDKILIESLNKESIELRKEWLKRMKQIDSDSLFYAFLVQAPNTSSNPTITDRTTKYEIEISSSEIEDAFLYFEREE